MRRTQMRSKVWSDGRPDVDFVYHLYATNAFVPIAAPDGCHKATVGF